MLFVGRITNDAREDEMEDNMVAVSGMVSNLRNMAIDMNSEITAQNKQLDKVNIQVSGTMSCSLVCDLLKSIIFSNLWQHWLFISRYNDYVYVDSMFCVGL